MRAEGLYVTSEILDYYYDYSEFFFFLEVLHIFSSQAPRIVTRVYPYVKCCYQ